MRWHVYDILDQGALVYVGISIAPRRRWKRHIANGICSRRESECKIVESFADEHIARRFERERIERFQPPKNKADTIKGRQQRQESVRIRKARGYPVGRQPKLSRRQFESLERDILEDKSATIAGLAKKYKVAEITVRQWFPDWRAKTQAERDAFRETKPLPLK